MKSEDPVRIISKIRNNRLMILKEESGKRIAEFAKDLGICAQTYYQLASLSRYPSEKTAKKISEKTGIGVDELFPQVLKSISKTTAIRTIPEHKLVALAEIKDRFLPPTQEEAIEADERRKAIENALRILAPREQLACVLRFGLRGQEVHSLGEIAEHFGVCRERAHQILEKALCKLQGRSRRKHQAGESSLMDFY